MRYVEHKIDIQTKGHTGYIAELVGYIPDTIPGVTEGKLRPAVLVLPGGGYGHLSRREGEPIALKLASEGICAFVLRYSVAPARFPQALCEALSAIGYIREHSTEWEIDENRIAVCGFSAGGHLAASTGVFWNNPVLEAYMPEDRMKVKPNLLLLSYPVITSGEFAHRGSFNNLIGEGQEQTLLELTSLEKQVTKEVPTTFIWHTYEDASVPVQNTLLFASALVAQGIPVEAHVYRRGGHGLSLGNHLVNGDKNYGDLHMSSEWINHAIRFLFDQE